MLITIAVCTWNRSSLLEKTLDRMTHLILPSFCTWEIVVVNNNCTDSTDRVIAAYSDRLPLKRVFESQQGLSNARNAAIAAAQGEYIIWTDDDVLVDEDWIKGYVDAFQGHPEAVIFGGPVHPWFEGDPPSWILEGWVSVSSAFATRDFGETPFMFDCERLPFGANFAVKASEQRSVLYDPKFGLSHGKIVLGEETQMMKSLLKSGLTGWWVPTALVRHWIPKYRQTTQYIRKYFMGHGRTLCRNSDSIPQGFFNKPRWLWKKAVVAEILYGYNRIFKSPQIWTSSLVKSSTYWGMIID